MSSYAALLAFGIELGLVALRHATGYRSIAPIISPGDVSLMYVVAMDVKTVFPP